MPDYRRNRVPGGSYFFTVNLLDRQSNLLIDHADLLRATVRRVRDLRPFHIDACVVLPEHSHALWTLPSGDVDYPQRWQAIKMGFSKGIVAGEFRTRSRRIRGERGIWQRRYWEHTIRDERDYASHMDYIHFNPVRHGLTSNVANWSYSSFHRAVARGFYPADWSGSDDGGDSYGERP